MISWNDFEKVDMRIGTIIEVDDFVGAKKPSYKLKVDFGSLGIKKSSAQITTLYKKEELINRQVIAVVNFPPKQIANFMSEVLILGVIVKKNGGVVLLQPDRKVPNGLKIA
ncbi:MAG: tRNA-binding protein [Promethearchaeota archaeon]